MNVYTSHSIDDKWLNIECIYITFHRWHVVKHWMYIHHIVLICRLYLSLSTPDKHVHLVSPQLYILLRVKDLSNLLAHFKICEKKIFVYNLNIPIYSCVYTFFTFTICSSNQICPVIVHATTAVCLELVDTVDINT